MSKREEKRTRKLGACVLLLLPAGKSAESINFDDDIYQLEVRGIHGKKKSVKHGEKTNTRSERTPFRLRAVVFGFEDDVR